MFACARCGKSPYAIGPSFGSFALAGKPIPDAKYTRCGYDLVKGEGLATSLDESKSGNMID